MVEVDIVNKVTKVRDAIIDRCLSNDKLDEMSSKLDLNYAEYSRFQELKTLAVASGEISLDAGMYIYGKLGESLPTFNEQPIEVKITLTVVFQELLKSSLKKS